MTSRASLQLVLKKHREKSRLRKSRNQQTLEAFRFSSMLQRTSDLGDEFFSPNGNFSWQKYLARRSGYAALAGHLFAHEDFLDKTLIEFLYYPTKIVNIKLSADSKNGKTAEIVSVFGNNAIVKFLPVQRTDGTELYEELNPGHATISIDQIHIDGFECAEMNMKLRDFVRVGECFELQDAGTGILSDDAEKVLSVHAVKIIKVYGGFVEVERIDELGEKEIVQITDVRCHRIGWAKHQNEQFGTNYVIKSEQLPGNHFTARWPFDFCPLKEHNFKPLYLLEMLDPSCRCKFVPAYVSRVLNQHFFLIRPILDVTSFDALVSQNEIVCHKNYPDIYPVGFCAKSSLRLTFPRGMGEESAHFYWSLCNKMKSLFANGCFDQTADTHSFSFVPIEFAPEALFSIPKITHAEKMRYCELKHPKESTLFVPAIIVRSYKNFVWIHMADNALTIPQIYSTNSNSLFRCGFAQSNGLQIKVPILNPDPIQPTNIETTTLVKSELWLPPTYINSACFSGPFLNRERVAKLNSCYHSAPLPIVIRSIIKDLLNCAVSYLALIEMFSADKHTRMPLMHIKFKHLNRRYRFNLEVCQRPSQFQGWLSMILKLIDACPKFISTTKYDVSVGCSLDCYQLESLPYMLNAGHSNTPTLQHLSKISIDFQRGISLQKKPKNVAKSKSSYPAKDSRRISINQPLFNDEHQSDSDDDNYLIAESKIPRLECLPDDSETSQSASSEQSSSSDKQKIQRASSSQAELDGEDCPNRYTSSPEFVNPQCLADTQLSNSMNQIAPSISLLPSANGTQQPYFKKPLDIFKGICISCPPINSNPRSWSCEDLASWIIKADANYTEVADKLLKEEVDGASFILFNVPLLQEQLGIKLGPAVKIAALIEELKHVIKLNEYNLDVKETGKRNARSF